MKMFEPDPFYMNRLNPAVFRRAAEIAATHDGGATQSIRLALSELSPSFPWAPAYYKEPEIYIDFYVDEIFGGRVYIPKLYSYFYTLPTPENFLHRSLNLLFCAEILETFEPHQKDIEWDLRFLREEKPQPGKGNA